MEIEPNRVEKLDETQLSHYRSFCSLASGLEGSVLFQSLPGVTGQGMVTQWWHWEPLSSFLICAAWEYP